MMKRKEFLKLGTAGLAAFGSGVNFLNPEGQTTFDQNKFSNGSLKKGYMLDTFPSGDDYSVLEKFRMLKTAGFHGVEPPSGLNRAEVMEAKEETGLEIPSVVVSTHWNNPLSSPDESVRKAGLDGLETALYDADEFGASTILLVPGVVNSNVSYRDVYERSQQEIKKMLPLAEELEIVIAIENVWNQFLLSPIEAARYVDEFKSPWVGWYFDIGNIMNYGWPSHWIEVLGERIAMIHIKEFSRQKRDDEGLWNGFRVNYLEGDNDWPKIMNALQKIGYSGYGIAEPAYRPENVAPQEFLNEYISSRMDKIFNHFE
ncbi:MAG: sugar phosphate isomerase/epimerase family protein [Balneolaceae bacterium]|nr:sugar phosphate isomerase/epimerase family protein [Balneolaceae bacterium]